MNEFRVSVQVTVTLSTLTRSEPFVLNEPPAEFQSLSDAVAYRQLIFGWLELRPLPELGLANRSRHIEPISEDPAGSLEGILDEQLGPERQAILELEKLGPVEWELDVPAWVNGNAA